jgi:hypothetical protein
LGQVGVEAGFQCFAAVVFLAEAGCPVPAHFRPEIGSSAAADVDEVVASGSCPSQPPPRLL